MFCQECLKIDPYLDEKYIKCDNCENEGMIGLKETCGKLCTNCVCRKCK